MPSSLLAERFLPPADIVLLSICVVNSKPYKLHTCHKYGDWLICLGLLLALLHSFKDMIDDFEIEVASQPALEESHMHQGSGPQQVLTPHWGMGYPPSLESNKKLLLLAAFNIWGESAVNNKSFIVCVVTLYSVLLYCRFRV